MKFRLLTLVFACAAAGAWAWQGSYARLNLSQEDFERLITNYVRDAVRTDSHISMPPLPGSKIVLGLSDEARASLVRECGLAAKAFVMSQLFRPPMMLTSRMSTGLSTTASRFLQPAPAWTRP